MNFFTTNQNARSERDLIMSAVVNFTNPLTKGKFEKRNLNESWELGKMDFGYN